MAAAPSRCGERPDRCPRRSYFAHTLCGQTPGPSRIPRGVAGDLRRGRAQPAPESALEFLILVVGTQGHTEQFSWQFLTNPYHAGRVSMRLRLSDFSREPQAKVLTASAAFQLWSQPLAISDR